jgi:hypothetical protein
MDFNHFCSISGEDFAIENDEYVIAGEKEFSKDYCNIVQKSISKHYSKPYNRLLGFGTTYFLVGILRRYEDVYYFIYMFCLIFYN